MDYCHPCGRHLNGALACAGCGTPVEELRHFSPTAAEGDHVYELDVVSEPAVPRRARRQQPAQRREAPSGRKATRARRARKRRGRNVVLGTFGLALAAGALSLAELATEKGGSDGAATSVRDKPVVESEVPEPTESDDAPELPAGVEEPAVTSSGSPRPATSATGTGRSGKRSGGPGEGAGTLPSASESAGGGPSPSSSADPSPGEGSPGSTADPSQGPGDPAPPGQEPPPPPDPAPTETCEPFLWWCI
ncbi:hypothetical protein [Streptomyces sp. NPDC058572]|uniref:SCO2400 family protein n=1 Tax=Streptomyces sp. NPDC058572 TaxID=3346546 RepID=UPI00366407B0